MSLVISHFAVEEINVTVYKCRRSVPNFVRFSFMYLPARRRPQGLVVIGVCLSVRTASAQVCVPLGHSSLYL